MYDDVRMLPARFARVLQRGMCHLYIQFCLIFQEVSRVGKARNQSTLKNVQPVKRRCLESIACWIFFNPGV